MLAKAKIIIYLLAGLIALALGSFLLQGIEILASLATYVDPLYVQPVFWAITGAVTLLLGYWFARIFIFPKPLFLAENATEDEQKIYQQRYLDRLKSNSFLKQQNLPCRSEDDIPVAIATLENEANRLIEETSKRVFIGTATVQNGRLDMLIVFCLISQLVYKIIKLFAQRPHAQDMLTLYKNVAATTFFAGALEDVVIEEYTQQIVGPLVASSVVGSVPGAQGIASVITTSLLDGSTNALLCMRCGIITRNYMSTYSTAVNSKTLRKSATKEAAAMFMRTSGDTITKVTQMLVSGASKSVKKNMTKAWEAVKGIRPNGDDKKIETQAESEDLGETTVLQEDAEEDTQKQKRFAVGEKLSSARKSVEDSTSRLSKKVCATGDKLKEGTQKAASTASENISSATATASKTFSKVTDNASSAASTISSAASKKVSSATSGIGTVASGIGSKATAKAEKLNRNAAEFARRASDMKSTKENAAAKAEQMKHQADQFAQEAKESGRKISTAASKAKELLKNPFKRKAS